MASSLLQGFRDEEVVLILIKGVSPWSCFDELGMYIADGGEIINFIDPPHRLGCLKIMCILGMGFAGEFSDSS